MILMTVCMMIGIGVTAASPLLPLEFLYSGISGPSFHNPFAASANTDIRRYGSTAGFYYFG